MSPGSGSPIPTLDILFRCSPTPARLQGRPEVTLSTYTGRCHCGAVQFSVDLELQNLMTCNCSICGRTGSIMAFVPRAALTLTAGEGAQTDYQFGAKRIHHLFCSTCGVRSYGTGAGEDGSEWAMINVRCLDDVDVHQLSITRQYDGRGT